MDGLLIVDKPVGPTSHDVVSRVRRALGERRVGHTGTLDPLASGVLPLVLGRATRLARFLSASDKSYEAVVRLGVATDTYDADGAAVGSHYTGALPSQGAIANALETFRGTYLQQPPAFSAKKIDGRRSYHLARQSAAVSAATLAPLPAVQVNVSRITLLTVDADRVRFAIDCGAGFYVRSLAHDLGQRLGTGAHLESLRRTRAGDLTAEDARPLEDIERNPTGAASALIPLSGMLQALEAVVLTAEGVRRAAHGRDLGPDDFVDRSSEADQTKGWMRLLDERGELVGLAEPVQKGAELGASVLLHPSVVLL